MTSLLTYLLLLTGALHVTPVTGSATAVLLQYDSPPTCAGDFFELLDFQYSCGSECTLGSEANFTGKIYFESYVTNIANITVVACPLSYDWSCYTVLQHLEEVNTCDNLAGVYYGQTCPAAGSYLYDFSLALPGYLTRAMYWGSYAFQVRAVFEGVSGGTTECSIDVQTVKAKYQMTWALTGFAALIAGVTTVVVRRRRRINTTNEHNAEGVEFQRMKESDEISSVALA